MLLPYDLGEMIFELNRWETEEDDREALLEEAAEAWDREYYAMIERDLC